VVPDEGGGDHQTARRETKKTWGVPFHRRFLKGGKPKSHRALIQGKVRDPSALQGGNAQVFARGKSTGGGTTERGKFSWWRGILLLEFTVRVQKRARDGGELSALEAIVRNRRSLSLRKKKIAYGRRAGLGGGKIPQKRTPLRCVRSTSWAWGNSYVTGGV